MAAYTAQRENSTKVLERDKAFIMGEGILYMGEFILEA